MKKEMNYVQMPTFHKEYKYQNTKKRKHIERKEKDPQVDGEVREEKKGVEKGIKICYANVLTSGEEC